MDKVSEIRSLLREIDELKAKREKCDVIIAKTDARFYSPVIDHFRRAKRNFYQMKLLDALRKLNAIVMTG